MAAFGCFVLVASWASPVKFARVQRPAALAVILFCVTGLVFHYGHRTRPWQQALGLVLLLAFVTLFVLSPWIARKDQKAEKSAKALPKEDRGSA
jgi:FtsH-binding integral membrane protein